MKKIKNQYIWLFAVVLLGLLLALSIYLGVSGWYFSVDTSLVTDFVLGSNMQIAVAKNSANSLSLNFSGAFISGEKLDQVVSVRSLEQQQNLMLRAKAFVYTSAGQFCPISLQTTQNWTFNLQDGYYYFSEPVLPSSQISLCNQIYLDQQYTLSSARNYIITFVVESLSTEYSAQEFWGQSAT